jgi:hypothetical protein
MTIRKIGRYIILSALAGIALPESAQAASQKEAFRDWTASLDEVNTGEDLRKTCVATTSVKDAQGKSSTLSLAISNGDALPPDAYPSMTITAGGLPDGESVPVAFEFGDKRIDAQGMGDGKQLMINNSKETSLPLLRAMASGSTLEATVAGAAAPALSLKGFTAAYRQLGTWCGFKTDDVAK